MRRPLASSKRRGAGRCRARRGLIRGVRIKRRCRRLRTAIARVFPPRRPTTAQNSSIGGRVRRSRPVRAVNVSRSSAVNASPMIAMRSVRHADQLSPARTSPSSRGSSMRGAWRRSVSCRVGPGLESVRGSAPLKWLFCPFASAQDRERSAGFAREAHHAVGVDVLARHESLLASVRDAPAKRRRNGPSPSRRQFKAVDAAERLGELRCEFTEAARCLDW